MRSLTNAPTRVLSATGQRRWATAKFTESLPKLRNIGISAHIDSGKTTTSERILYYTGKISRVHEVKGGGDVGATMDSMELEKERGITIRSAATYCKWKDTAINVIDTPGHVDFTIEVERALRVLDGAVLLMCGVGGVQSQTLTVDRQMRRYGVPRVCFINKLDRDGANPARALKQLRERLLVNAAFITINIGISQDLEGVVDLIKQKAVYFDGPMGDNLRYEEIPSFMLSDVDAARKELLARLADNDEGMEEHFLSETMPTEEEFKVAIRKLTIDNKFVPVMVGSAYKNKGIQLLLDAIESYLPNPGERANGACTIKKVAQEDGTKIDVKDQPVSLVADDEKPLVALVFKMEETSASGFSNYVRVYQGKLRKEQLLNVRTGKSFVPGKLVRMHANSTESVDEVCAGDICSIIGDFGASSGDTIMRVAGHTGTLISCEDMYVPPRVISASIKPANDRDLSRMQERLNHFMREDPTFNFYRNNETGEFIIEGMGELHLDIYVERCKREFGLNLIKGKPTVNYREVIQKRQEFDFIYKRQSGGAGQWAHVRGHFEPLDIDMSTEKGTKNKITSTATNGDIKENLQKSFMKHFERKIFPQGMLINAPIWGLGVHLAGGAMHEIDSNDIAFRNCAQELWETFLPKLQPTLIEPWMDVEISCPSQFASDVANEFSKRGGVVQDQSIEGVDAIITGETALDTMFGFINDLRSYTKGMGEFSMQFKEYRPMPVFKAQTQMDERNKTLGRTSMKLAD